MNNQEYYQAKVERHEKKWHNRFGERETAPKKQPERNPKTIDPGSLSMRQVIFETGNRSAEKQMQQRYGPTLSASHVNENQFPQDRIDDLGKAGFAMEGQYDHWFSLPNGDGASHTPVLPVYIKAIDTTVFIPDSEDE